MATVEVLTSSLVHAPNVREAAPLSSRPKPPEQLVSEAIHTLFSSPLLTEESMLALRIRALSDMTHDQFFDFCQQHKDLRIERTQEGEVVIMAPTGGITGWRNANLTMIFGLWAKQQKEGVVFDSSTVFVLPNGAERSPDVAWVKRSRLAALTKQQKEQFPPLCPDFVLELRSPSDGLIALQNKMEEYIANGAQLGWLLDPRTQTVYIYRPGKEYEYIDHPATLAGDPELPGFILDLQPIWNPDF